MSDEHVQAHVRSTEQSTRLHADGARGLPSTVSWQGRGERIWLASGPPRRESTKIRITMESAARFPPAPPRSYSSKNFATRPVPKVNPVRVVPSASIDSDGRGTRRSVSGAVATRSTVSSRLRDLPQLRATMDTVPPRASTIGGSGRPAAARVSAVTPAR
jgi:hypothetical protein